MNTHIPLFFNSAFLPFAKEQKIIFQRIDLPDIVVGGDQERVISSGKAAQLAYPSKHQTKNGEIIDVSSMITTGQLNHLKAVVQAQVDAGHITPIKVIGLTRENVNVVCEDIVSGKEVGFPFILTDDNGEDVEHTCTIEETPLLVPESTFQMPSIRESEQKIYDNIYAALELSTEGKRHYTAIPEGEIPSFSQLQKIIDDYAKNINENEEIDDPTKNRIIDECESAYRKLGEKGEDITDSDLLYHMNKLAMLGQYDMANFLLLKIEERENNDEREDALLLLAETAAANGDFYQALYYNNVYANGGGSNYNARSTEKMMLEMKAYAMAVAIIQAPTRREYKDLLSELPAEHFLDYALSKAATLIPDGLKRPRSVVNARKSKLEPFSLTDLLLSYVGNPENKGDPAYDKIAKAIVPLLRNMEDPNEKSESDAEVLRSFGLSPLARAILLKENRLVVEALIRYGADPREPTGVYLDIGVQEAKIQRAKARRQPDYSISLANRYVRDRMITSSRDVSHNNATNVNALDLARYLRPDDTALIARLELAIAKRELRKNPENQEAREKVADLEKKLIDIIEAGGLEPPKDLTEGLEGPDALFAMNQEVPFRNLSYSKNEDDKTIQVELRTSWDQNNPKIIGHLLEIDEIDETLKKDLAVLYGIRGDIEWFSVSGNRVTALETSSTRLPKELVGLTELVASKAQILPSTYTKLTDLEVHNATSIPNTYTQLQVLSAYLINPLPPEFKKMTYLRLNSSKTQIPTTYEKLETLFAPNLSEGFAVDLGVFKDLMYVKLKDGEIRYVEGFVVNGVKITQQNRSEYEYVKGEIRRKEQ